MSRIFAKPLCARDRRRSRKKSLNLGLKKLAKDPVYIPGIYNYFIHQLINQRDLQTIGNAVSYIDKITKESILTLPVGTSIFSGIATPMPLKLKIEEPPDKQKPDSHTLQFEKVSGE
jgi:hypothetical protein